MPRAKRSDDAAAAPPMPDAPSAQPTEGELEGDPGPKTGPPPEMIGPVYLTTADLGRFLDRYIERQAQLFNGLRRKEPGRTEFSALSRASRMAKFDILGTTRERVEPGIRSTLEEHDGEGRDH